MDPMKFSEMSYTRPDIDALLGQCKALAAKAAGAHFVKTSTGFSTGGANVHDVALMRETVGPDVGVKASGGVRTHEDADKMIKAGATRLGTSSGVKPWLYCLR